MIEARALVSINFLNLSENYDFMSRWLGVYDKYAKLLKEFDNKNNIYRRKSKSLLNNK